MDIVKTAENKRSSGSRCVPIHPDPVILNKFDESLRLTRGIKSPVLTAGDIEMYIPIRENTGIFKHTSSQRWTLGMLLQRAHDDTIIASRWDAAVHPEHYDTGSPRPTGEDFYENLKITKFNIYERKIYVTFSST
jgi:hypothetical protein